MKIMDLNPDGGTYEASGNVRVSVASSEKPASPLYLWQSFEGGWLYLS